MSTKATAQDGKSSKAYAASEKTEGSQANGSIFLYSASPKATCIRYAITNQVALKNANPIEAKAGKKLTKYQETMRQRWLKANQYLPAVDKQDIRKEVPIINGDSVKPLPSRHQHHAEFTQTSYLRLRQQEEQYLMFNYLEPSASPGFQAYLDSLDQENVSFSQRLQNTL